MMVKALRFRLASSLVLLGATFPALSQTPEPIEFFEKKIRPIFATSCKVCHNPEMKTAGLDLSSATGFVRGGQSGPLVSKGDPGSSRLLKVVSYEEKLKMPPTGKLKDHQIADLTKWVEIGAPWPGAVEVHASLPELQGTSAEFTEEQKSFWAFQPVRDSTPPKINNESGLQSPIDRFILAKLEEKGIQPSAPADKMTLLRRATYDLTGLPPTEKEMADFLADESPQAFERVVERLLSSPRYGERWGRNWLDVARYADSTGNDEDHHYPYSWRYRDYVIDAFNSDMPYDQFVREQIAGDLLPSDDPDGINSRGIVATGLLALGPKAIAQQDKKKMLYDVYDEQMDVVSKAFLGLTMTCARCHDHKFDPILQRDYYSLVGIFAGTRNFQNTELQAARLLFKPLVPREVYNAYREHQDQIFHKKFDIEDIVTESVDSHNARLYLRLKDYMIAARRIYQGGASIDEAAEEGSLDKETLRRWVDYLKPKAETPQYLKEWHEATDQTVADVAALYEQRFDKQTEDWQRTLDKWRKAVRKTLKEGNMPPPPKPRFRETSDPFYDDVNFKEGGAFFLSPEQEEALLSDDSRRMLAQLRGELEYLEETAPPEPPLACAVDEGKPVTQQLFIRGDHNNPGEVVPRGFPLILGGGSVLADHPGSGRLALAEWLTRPDHPLTARVMVNRIWQWHFGEGIVRTPNNFGKMGERPTHPELLDYLALRFVESGWSVKAMHRLMMLSSAYQVSSEVSEEQNAADPLNHLFSYFNRRRLDVEEIHDGLLAIEGSLNLKMGGTLQEEFGTDRENSSKRLSMDPEIVDRRMVYIPLRRANLPTLLNLFDFGDATTTNGKRSHTNVAPQALFIMNSEFVAKRAANLADQLFEAEPGDSQRMERAYRITLNRRPELDEVSAALTYIDNVQEKFGDSLSERGAWSSFFRILLASNEFIYVD